MSKKTLDPQVQAAVDALQSKVSTDPQIRAFIAQTMQLTGADPNSDANKALMSQRSAQLTQLVKAKGLLPTNGQYTLDPSNGNLVRHGGWAGLSGLEKTAFIAAAAATGVGGAAALGAFGGGAAAAGAGAASAPTVAGGAGIAGLATPGVTAGLGTAGAGAGIAGLSSRILGGISDVSKLTGGVDSALNGGTTPAMRGAVVNSQAQQEALNRFKEAQLAQNGPSVDAQALANEQHAGRLAHYTPPSAEATALMTQYGRRVSGVDPETMRFAGTMQDELAKREAAGQPMTLSGVPPAGPQELADTAAARAAAMNPNGTGVTGAINTGTQLAGLAPTFMDLLKRFGVGAAPNTKPVRLVGGPQDPFGDPGEVNY